MEGVTAAVTSGSGLISAAAVCSIVRVDVIIADVSIGGTLMHRFFICIAGDSSGLIQSLRHDSERIRGDAEEDRELSLSCSRDTSPIEEDNASGRRVFVLLLSSLIDSVSLASNFNSATACYARVCYGDQLIDESNDQVERASKLWPHL